MKASRLLCRIIILLFSSQLVSSAYHIGDEKSATYSELERRLDEYSKRHGNKRYFPDIANLYYNDGKKKQLLCGAFLVTPSFVMTSYDALMHSANGRIPNDGILKDHKTEFLEKLSLDFDWTNRGENAPLRDVKIIDAFRHEYIVVFLLNKQICPKKECKHFWLPLRDIEPKDSKKRIYFFPECRAGTKETNKNFKLINHQSIYHISHSDHRAVITKDDLKCRQHAFKPIYGPPLGYPILGINRTGDISLFGIIDMHVSKQKFGYYRQTHLANNRILAKFLILLANLRNPRDKEKTYCHSIESLTKQACSDAALLIAGEQRRPHGHKIDTYI